MFELLEPRLLLSVANEVLTEALSAPLVVQQTQGDAGGTINQALETSIGSRIEGQTILPGDDVDMFRFTVDQGQRIGFDIDLPSGSLDSYLRIFNSRGTQINRNRNAPAPGEFTTTESYIDHTFNIAGTYFVGVSGFANTMYDPNTGEGRVAGSVGPYILELVDLLGEPDDESIDRIEDATPIEVGGSVSDAIETPRDVDMYEFNVTSGQRLSFNIDRPQGGTLDSFIRIFNSRGTQIISNRDGAAPGETLDRESYLEHTFVIPGTYYIGVSGFPNTTYNPVTGTDTVPGSTGNYTLIVSDVVEAPIEDPDDRLTTARDIAIGDRVTDTIQPGTDVDMFRVDVQQGQRIGFNIDLPSGSNLDSFLRIFNAWGTEINRNRNAPAPGEFTTTSSYIDHTFNVAGTYYVGVSGHPNVGYNPVTGTGDVQGSTGQYSLELIDLLADRDDESVQRIEDAMLVAVGASVNGSIDTPRAVDMYRFDVAPAQRLAFDIDRPQGGTLDSFIRIFNERGTQIARNNNAAAPGEALSTESYLEHTFNMGGTFFIGVSGNPNNAYNPITGTDTVNGSTGDYTLHIRPVVA